MTLNQKQNFAQAKINKDSEKVRRGINLKLVNRLLMALIAITGVYYVVSINDLAIKGFVLRDTKNAVQKYQDDNNQMELAIMKLESYDNIEKRALSMNMVKVSKIDYINVQGRTVAMK